jgi:lipopolysaccharide transport system ATP-binding protein
MSKNEIAIKVENLSKKYVIGKQKDSSLRGTLSNLFKSNKSDEDEFWALKDVNFEINKGDVIGIIGKNGAGKSTLLKILSQITAPTEGRIEINGRVASLLEVGTGFHPELTGRENIYLNGTILGMSRKEVKAKFDEIVDFSGVEKFIDTPVKHYSSGMYVRLAFAVAAHLEPEILIIDEVLAVGDAEFQKKCLGKMQDVAQHGRTVIFVSHNMAAVQNTCSKCIVLKNGEIDFQGSVSDSIKNYFKNEFNKTEKTNFPLVFKNIEINDFSVFDKDGDNCNRLVLGGLYNILLTLKNLSTPKLLNIRIQIFGEDDILLSTLNTSHAYEYTSIAIDDNVNFNCQISKLSLSPGNYYLSIEIADHLEKKILCLIEKAYTFTVESGDFYGNGKLPSKNNLGQYFIEHNWNAQINNSIN